MPVEEEVIKQIGLPENNRLKYEPLLPSSGELGRLICAFANEFGGILILGILNKNNKLSIKGLSSDFQVNTVLKNALSKIVPYPSLKSGFVSYHEKQLFFIKVEKSDVVTTYDRIEYGIKLKKVYRINRASEANSKGNLNQSTIEHFNQSPDKTIFISYNWKNKAAAIRLYDFLKVNGYLPTIDDHSLKFKDSISSFMESIRVADYAVLIISDEYLKSENCMIEVLHVLKDRNSRSKILPIRHEDVKIFKPADRIKYIEFWKTQIDEREKDLSGVDPTSAIEEIKKLKNAKRIYQDIGDFLSDISDLITSTIEEQEKTLYENIMIYLESTN